MGRGRKTVVVGQVIDPDTWGNLVWDQSVQTFASWSDRVAQWPTPHKGAVWFQEDSGSLVLWDGVNARILWPEDKSQLQHGTSVITMTSYIGRITFPVAFPVDVQTILATAGDRAGNLASVVIYGFANSDRSGFSFNGFTETGAAINAGAVRVNWVAYGA